MKKNTLIITLLMLPSLLFGQKNVFLNIEPVFNAGPLELGVELSHNNGEVYELDHFDYYVSDILITHDGGQVSTATDMVYLFEPNNHSFYLGALNLDIIEQIEFTVGIPDRLNVQGGSEALDISAYPEEHPLSFQSPSMYWGWSFGYMPMIIGGGEGSNAFELHSVGAHLQRQVVLPVVQTNVSASQVELVLQCHVDRWVNGIELLTIGAAHGATPVNITAMDNVMTEDVFTLSPFASLASNSAEAPHIYVKNGKLYYSGLPAGTAEICTYDQLGRNLSSTHSLSANGVMNLDTHHAGVLFVFCRDIYGGVLEKQTIFIP